MLRLSVSVGGYIADPLCRFTVVFKAPIEIFVEARGHPAIAQKQNIVMVPTDDPETLIRVSAKNCFWDLPEQVCVSMLKARCPHLASPSDGLFETLSKLVQHELGCNETRLNCACIVLCTSWSSHLLIADGFDRKKLPRTGYHLIAQARGSWVGGRPWTIRW